MAEKKEESAQSRLLKAKKCLASMGAKSTVGQKTISHFLGVPGTNLLQSLQGAAAKDVGEQRAKALIEDIYILACKGKVLYDAKIITPQNTKEFVAPVNQTCLAIFLILEEKRKNPSKNADCSGVALKFAQLESLVVNLLKPHIKDKNVEKTKEVFKYFGSKRFLDLFVNNPNYHEFKTTLHRSKPLASPLISSYLAPISFLLSHCLLCVVCYVSMCVCQNHLPRNLKLLIVDRLEEACLLPPPRLCKAPECQVEALDEDGKFAGSNYCTVHHEKQYNALLKEPNVHHFLAENGCDYEPFIEMADKFFPPNARLMYRGISNYLTTTQRLRKNFAEGIYEKYLSDNATNKVTCLSPACVAKIQQTYKAAEVRVV